MKRARPRRVAPTAQGDTLADFCAREQVARSTVWRWQRKGLVVVSRGGPRSAVRVWFAPGHDPAEKDGPD